MRFLPQSYFLDLHERALKIDGNPDAHKIRFAVCFTLDALFRLIAVALFLAIVGGLAWKALAPLPALWS